MTIDFNKILRKALGALQSEKVRIDRQIATIRRILAAEVDDRRMVGVRDRVGGQQIGIAARSNSTRRKVRKGSRERRKTK